MDKNGKTKKRSPKIVLPILLCVIGIALVTTIVVLLMGGTQSSAENGKLYWNVNGSQFLNDAGLSDREPDSDGYYKVLFAVDGEQIEYKVSEKALVDKIDNKELMGLVIDKNGIVTEILDPDEVTGGEVVSKWFVLSTDGKTMTVSASGNEDDLTYNLKLTEDTGIYDVSGAEPVGQSAKVEEGDCVRVFKNKEGKIYYVFLVQATADDFAGTQAEGFCQHCKSDVTWYEWTEADAVPMEAGHWRLKNDIQLVREAQIKAAVQLVVDLNGKTVHSNKNQRVYNSNHDGCTLVLLDQSGEQTGTLKGYGYPKNGGVVYLQKGNLEIYSGTVDASEVDSDSFGAAIRINGGTTAKMYGGTIIGGTSNRTLLGSGEYAGGGGGSVYVASNATYTMYDGTIRDGKVFTLTRDDGKLTMGMGGNIYLSTYATFIMEGGTISGGSSDRYGGNIYVGTDSTFTMTGGVMEAGTAVRGGNIYLNTNSEMSISDGTIQKGIASEQGGNICGWGKTAVNMTGGIIADGEAVKRGGNLSMLGEIIMSNGVIKGGKATSTAGDNNNGIGGNIYVALYTATEDDKKVDYRGKLTVTGGTITSGVSTHSRGGNIYLGDRADLILSGVVENGVSAVSGGNIFAQKDSTVVINKGGIVRNGKAGDNGGNINTGTGIAVTIDGGQISNGTAGKSGGNLYCSGLGNLTFKSGSITDGKADKRGGNICTFGSVIMSGGTITGGEATNDKGDNDNGIGGNVYIAMYEEEVNGKKVYHRADMKISGGTIANGISKYSRGGNVYMAEQVDFVLSGKALIENGICGVSGGNLFAQSSSTITINGGTIQNGRAGDSGGNINTGTDITIVMNDGKVLNGSAAKSGGNINCGGRSTFTMKGGSLLNGTAVVRGGNISSLGSIVLFGGEIKGGKALGTPEDDSDGLGGNIYFASYESDGKTYVSSFDMAGGIISDGEAERRGGNVCIYSGEVTINGGKIISGTSLLDGGNFYVSYKTEMTMTGGEIVSGAAEENGGNICCTGGHVTMSGGSIRNGTAVVKGGNIYAYTPSTVENKGTITMYGGTISGGKTTHTKGSNENGIGGNLFLGDYKLTMTNATISGGESVTSRAGNIYLRSAELVVGKGSVIKDGKAAHNGGNIMGEKQSVITLKGGSIQNGKAGNQGGNIRIGSSTLVFNGGSILNGQSIKEGGNVYLDTNSSCKAVGGKMTISGGISDGIISNLHLPGTIQLEVEALESGSSIGITTASNRIFAGNVTADYKNYFFADGTDKVIYFERMDNTLSIKNKE